MAGASITGAAGATGAVGVAGASITGAAGAAGATGAAGVAGVAGASVTGAAGVAVASITGAAGAALFDSVAVASYGLASGSDLDISPGGTPDSYGLASAFAFSSLFLVKDFGLIYSGELLSICVLSLKYLTSEALVIFKL